MDPTNDPGPDDDRREFLKKCGQFAALTPPAVTFLLSTSMSSKAIAASAGGGGGGGGGGAGAGAVLLGAPIIPAIAAVETRHPHAEVLPASAPPPPPPAAAPVIPPAPPPPLPTPERG